MWTKAAVTAVFVSASCLGLAHDVFAAPATDTKAVPMRATAASKRFIVDAMKGDSSEIMLGHMAQDKGGNDKLKQFGQMLVTDHTEAKQKAVGVAQQIGVKPSDQPAADGAREMKKLEGLTGPAFDKEFVAYMVKDHSADIAKFSRAAKREKGPVAEFAHDSLQTLQKHLDAAKQLSTASQ